jgi:hypothetical protein
MHPFVPSAFDRQGNAIEGALMAITDELGRPADVYADQDGVTLIAPGNRLTTADGIFECWLAAGLYQWWSSYQGVSSEPQWIEVGPSAGGGDKNYVHAQGTGASSWSVSHNLGKYPAVDVVDNANSVLLPDVRYDSPDALTLTFGAPVSGKAYVN